MKKKTLKIISTFTLIIFAVTTFIPPSYATIIAPPIGLPCWNDASLASATGGDDGLGPEGDLNNRGLDREADPVILSKGNFVHQRQDLFIPSRGLPLEINRIYNTQSKLEGPFGIGWSHNYDTHLIQVIENTETYILRRNPDGSKDRFLDNLDGTYETITPGCYDTLLKYETLPPEYSQIAPVGLNSSFHIRTKHGTDYLFDISGKLRVIADRNKNKITLQYDVNEKLTQIYDTLNRTLDLTYNTNNKIIEITDFSGRRFTYKYDTNQNLISAATPGTIDYPLGLTTTYTYDTKNNVTSISDPKNNTYLTNIYDSNGRVIEQIYGADKFYFQYLQALDSSDKLTVFTDRNNNKIAYYFNEDGTTYKKLEYTQQLRLEDPEYYETLYEYNIHRERTRIVHPEGNETNYQYDDKGNILSIIRKPKLESLTQNIITTFTYEPEYNFIKTITDPKGNVTTYDYGTNGNLTKITYPTVDSLTPETTFTYTPFGQVETVTDPKGTIYKYEYDTNTSYLTRITNDYGDQIHFNINTQLSYNSLGNILTVTDAKGNTTEFEYDVLNQLTKTISPAPYNYQTKYTYDENGNLIKLETQANEIGDQWQTTEYEYDILDQLVLVNQHLTDTESLTTQFQYDANGNRTKAIDPQSNAANYIYDSRDLLYQVTDSRGDTTEYTYDKNGNMNKIKDAKGNITAYKYDDFNRLLSTTYPDASSQQYNYDFNSNLLTKQTRKGDIITYTYDDLNRRISKTYPDTSYINYTYDISSRLKTLTDSKGTTTYAYDNLNRVTQIQYPDTKTTGYEYDNLGNQTKLIYPDNTFVTYDYDNLNRLIKINDDTEEVLAAYTYDTLSRRTQTGITNNTQTTYIYDNLNRLVNQANKINLGTDISIFNYTYDKAGNRTTKTTAEGTHNYTYDQIYQLTDADYPDTSGLTDTTYTYDQLSNRITVTDTQTTTYTTNNLNQYTDIDNGQGLVLSLQYDANGNLTNDDKWIYTYDYENRLIKAENSSLTALYTYDSYGRRIHKDIKDAGDVLVSSTSYLYDGDQVISEYDETDTVLRKYIYGQGIDEPILIENTIGDRYYYHFDGLGSVTELTDSAGSIVEKYKYDVYGKTTIRDTENAILNKSQIDNPYGYTGRRLDTETGLYYYRARHYNPETGRFQQTDPIGYYDSMNLYQYVSNSPTNFVDPWGLCKGNKGSSWWDDSMFSFEDLMNALEDISNALLLNPMADGMPHIPLDQGIGLIGIGVVKGLKKIVIGETGKRVAKKALKIGADYYKPVKKVSDIGIKKAMRNNYQWLRRKIQQGYKIIDIGLDRARKGGRGIFYKAEKRWLKLWGK